jgi:glycerate-2-kinase
MSLPVRGITLADKRYVTKLLLSAGAEIQDLNIVRMHLSQVKGGKLIRFSPKSTTFLTLVISDVIGDKVQIIASGPTCPDRTSFVDAKRILSKYDIWNVDNSHLSRIRKVVTNGIKEEQKGNFDGDVAEHGKWLSHLANELQSLSSSFAVVLGGETTVRLNKQGNNGTGGRNQESALYALLSLKSYSGQEVSICCVGTDGIDGNSTAAGALVNGTMVNKDRDSKMQLLGYLENHDSSNAFRRLGSQVITGKTLTNVNDVNVICKLASSNRN